MKNVKYVGSSSFYRCTSLEYVLGNKIEYIGISSFQDCNLLKEVTLFNVRNIGKNAFFHASSLSIKVDMPELEDYIDTNTFAYSGITEIKSLGKITSIKDGQNSTYGDYGTFFECTELTKVNLPSTLNYIGNYCFSGCNKLDTIICNSITPPTLGPYSFFNTPVDLKIYVPDGSVESYKTATNWNTYADRIHPLSEYTEE